MYVYDDIGRRLRKLYRETQEPLLQEALDRLEELVGRGGEPLDIDTESLKNTCMACPTQWSAWTPDGRYVYIRYRSARLSVEIVDAGLGMGVEPPDFEQGNHATTWFEAVLPMRDPLDGYIELGEVCEIANLQLV